MRKCGIFLSHKSAILYAEGIQDNNLKEILFLHYNTEHKLLLEFLDAFGAVKELKV
ncbi:MAG: hypothetical protein ABF322_05660 [Lentimonas sp.]